MSYINIVLLAWIVVITLRLRKIERERRRERIVSRLADVISQEVW